MEKTFSYLMLHIPNKTLDGNQHLIFEKKERFNLYISNGAILKMRFEWGTIKKKIPILSLRDHRIFFLSA